MFNSLKIQANGRMLAWTCLKAGSVPSRRACAFVMGGMRGFMHIFLLFLVVLSNTLEKFGHDQSEGSAKCLTNHYREWLVNLCAQWRE